ncbi:uncharacterized protein FOMMEDRAFT_168139 [Fomitiporia mediterranea MF3/22]|uniref:uncharacterized protein n=1 Tax=Fomitiporia mediterranea (strain MF3/22) TaxID=694068 RepID=UPI0004408C29|nr:uncharacterized protein FOMMEDRAFT_168139 [Fomitiporia mediterranea MF3/22]EJD03068.1 hypothetical protein FOMMEDRAFT_168139 [Fomitiporia mediterranea MF3/22]
MVSFQCDACQDVVKKPKLDAHSYRCYSSFTCVDCSKTFHTSAEWKGHTSCISEAEKYQKGLYKGKKNKQQNGSIGPRGDKVQTPGHELTNGPVLSESPSEPKEETQHKPSGDVTDRVVAVGSEDDSTVPILKADVMNSTPTKKLKKDKKRKRREAEVVDVHLNDAPTNGESKKKKRTDVLEREEKMKAHGTAERKEPTTPLDSEPIQTTKRKKNNDKNRSKDDNDKCVSAPPLTEPQQSPFLMKQGDGTVSGKKRKRKHRESDETEKISSEPTETMRNNASDDIPVKKKKKKEKSKKDQESNPATDPVKDGLNSELEMVGKRQPDDKGNEELGARSTKKEKKKKEKTKKIKSLEETTASS